MNSSARSSEAFRRDAAHTVETGGQHQPVRRHADGGQRVRQRLMEVGLEDRGERLEDEWRDRRSNGHREEQESG